MPTVRAVAAPTLVVAFVLACAPDRIPGVRPADDAAAVSLFGGTANDLGSAAGCEPSTSVGSVGSASSASVPQSSTECEPQSSGSGSAPQSSASGSAPQNSGSAPQNSGSGSAPQNSGSGSASSSSNSGSGSGSGPQVKFAPTAVITMPSAASCGVRVALDGRSSFDDDGRVIRYDWFDGAQRIARGANAREEFDVGEHAITLRVMDNDRLTGTATGTLSVTDTDDPALRFSVRRETLWPASGKMRRVAHNVRARDMCSDASVDISVSILGGKEKPKGEKKGESRKDEDSKADYVVVERRHGGYDVYVRAEHDGKKDRVYTITAVATDEAGNATVEQGTVTVPVKKPKHKFDDEKDDKKNDADDDAKEEAKGETKPSPKKSKKQS